MVEGEVYGDGPRRVEVGEDEKHVLKVKDLREGVLGRRRRRRSSE